MSVGRGECREGECREGECREGECREGECRADIHPYCVDVLSLSHGVKP